MNSLHMLNKEFENGWGFDIKYKPDGFGDMYTTDYAYSVRTYNSKSCFSNFKNFQYPSEVFTYIAEVQKW